MKKAKTEIYDRIIDCLNRAGNVLIVSHLDPDGDSIGSQLALRRYLLDIGKNVNVASDGTIPGKYRFLPDIERIRTPHAFESEGKPDLAVVLECPELGRAGRAADLIGDDTPIINIDHHPDNVGFGDIILIDKGAAAVGEILTEIFVEKEIPIDRDTATLLYTAILTDTGRFRFSSTTNRTMTLAGILIDRGADPGDIVDKVYYSFSETTLKLIGRAFSAMELHENGRICLVPLNRELLSGNGLEPADTEGMAEYTLYGADVMVGALLKEMDDHTVKVSLRSRDGINVSRLAHRYGGGGHTNAAGFTTHDSLAAISSRLLADLKEIVHDMV